MQERRAVAASAKAAETGNRLRFSSGTDPRLNLKTSPQFIASLCTPRHPGSRERGPRKTTASEPHRRIWRRPSAAFATICSGEGSQRDERLHSTGSFRRLASSPPGRGHGSATDEIDEQEFRGISSPKFPYALIIPCRRRSRAARRNTRELRRDPSSTAERCE